MRLLAAAPCWPRAPDRKHNFVPTEISHAAASHRTRTLILVIVLHAFTHVYQVALMPLYLPIRDSLHLSGVEQATLLLTVMYVAYFLPSYGMGILADRFSRKKLLAWGLAVN